MISFRKALALTFAMTLALTLASCNKKSKNESDSDGTAITGSPEAASYTAPEDDSSEEISDAGYNSQDESDDVFSDEVSTIVTPADMNMEQHSIEHKAYGIHLNYALPLLDQYEIDTTEPDSYWERVSATDSFLCHPKENAENGIEINISLNLLSKDDIGLKLGDEELTNAKTANGYDAAYSVKTYETDLGQKQEAYAAVYGESYLDAVLLTETTVISEESEASAEELEKIALAVANSVQFTDWDENALKTADGGFRIYSHKISVPANAVIAGKDTDIKLVFDQIYPTAHVDFADDGIQYAMATDIWSANGLKWEITKEKTDTYTPVTVGGHDAFAKLSPNSCTAEFVILFNEAHVETVHIYVEAFADGSIQKDDKKIRDVSKEMVSDENRAATLAKLTEYVDGFVSTWVTDETA